jgi:hypothetical protein
VKFREGAVTVQRVRKTPDHSVESVPVILVTLAFNTTSSVGRLLEAYTWVANSARRSGGASSSTTVTIHPSCDVHRCDRNDTSTSRPVLGRNSQIAAVSRESEHCRRHRALETSTNQII